MSEILLIRHGQSFANKRDFTAFGNIDSPLTERGLSQAQQLNPLLRAEFGIGPEEYDQPVLASEFTRAQQTAHYAGFANIYVDPIINESDVDREIMSGIEVIIKHRDERWAPDMTRARAGQFIDKIQTNELDYRLFFTHGLFIASVLLECDARSIETAAVFDKKRGYVPLQASITKLSL